MQRERERESEREREHTSAHAERERTPPSNATPLNPEWSREDVGGKRSFGRKKKDRLPLHGNIVAFEKKTDKRPMCCVGPVLRK